MSGKTAAASVRTSGVSKSKQSVFTCITLSSSQRLNRVSLSRVGQRAPKVVDPNQCIKAIANDPQGVARLKAQFELGVLGEILNSTIEPIVAGVLAIATLAVPLKMSCREGSSG